MKILKNFLCGAVLSLFITVPVMAAGTSTVSFDEIRITDNLGTWTATQGSTTVSTSLAAVDMVFITPNAYGSPSVYWLATVSGAAFTIQGWLAGTNGTKYVGTASGYWLAFDR